MNPFRHGPRGPLSLQARLMAAVTGFVSLILVVIAIATSVVLGNVLNGRLQDELATIAKSVGTTARPAAVIGHFVPNASDLVVGPTGVPNGTLVIVVAPNGAATGTVVTSDRVAQDLNALQIHQVVTALSQGRSSDEISRLGDYQFVHQPVPPTGDAQFEVITGLPRASVEAQITTLFSMIALTTIGGLILLALSTAITIRLALRPLREVAATANRVANQPLDRGDVSITERVPAAEADPRTETGLVGAALNTLLDHVDASLAVRQRNEERMRQFVADASHELRTPLSSIRGYSELSLRALSTSTAPEDPATASAHTALERIQAQSLRMTRLVEDLLLLARLEEGRELSLSTVDLSRLAIEGVEDARPTAPDHVWTIDVPEEPAGAHGLPGPAAAGGRQPGRQPAHAHSRRHARHGRGRRGRRRRGAPGARRRTRHRPAGAGRAVQPVRPLRPLAQPRHRRILAGLVDHEGDRGGPRRHDLGAERAGRHRVHRAPAAHAAPTGGLPLCRPCRRARRGSRRRGRPRDRPHHRRALSAARPAQ